MQYNLRHFDDAGNETPQWGFFHSRAPIQFFGGAFANGKTTALVVKALHVASNYPGANMLLARATYAQLNDTLRKTFMAWIPPEWVKKRPSQEDNTCYLTNGTIVNFRYVAQRGKQQADGTTTSNLLSATFDFIGVDQLEDPTIMHKDFLDLMGRLRGSTVYRPVGEDDPTMPATGPRWLCLTANPTGNWVYKELIAPLIAWKQRGVITEKLLVDPRTNTPIIELFEGSTYTNKHNLPDDYIRNLEATYKGQQRQRYLVGEWAAYEGLVYSQYNRKVHAITRQEAMAHLVDCKERHVDVEAVEAYDFGLASPSCYGFGFVDDWGRLFIIDGFYLPEFDYTEHPRAINDIRDKYKQLVRITKPINADPSIFKTKIMGTRARADTVGKFLRESFDVVPASNDVISGIAKVGSYLNGRPDIPHFLDATKQGPLLYVCEDLEWWHDEAVAYYWRRSPSGQHVDEPQDGNDHAMDMTKYMMNKLPQAREIIIPADKLPPPWMRWHEAPDHDERRR